MAKGMYPRMGWMGRTAACCVVLAALLASGAVLAAVAGPADAAFAGGNGKVAFYRNGDVWTMNADGTGATKLTTNYNAESNPAVSPDGSRIAYEFLRGIWVMNADGTGGRMLTDGQTATDEDPAWSADGTTIAFSRNGADIWAMNADGSDPTNLTNTPSTNDDEVEPAFSPNGAKIAYTRIGCEPERRGAHCVFVMNADGSGQTNLTHENSMQQCPNSPGYFFNGASRNPAWSPDGQKIAFAGPVICPHNMGSNIWTMNADGSGKTPLNNDNGSGDLKPVFSPDGTRVIFESNRDGNGHPTELYSMPAGGAPDGSAITRLTTNSLWDSDADWSVSSPTCTVTGNGAIEGTPGNDVICGGPNGDTIDGLGGNDVVLGGGGNDTLVGASGRDTLNGGPGTDAASFDGSAAPVEASLVTGFALRAGTPEGVALVGIENVTGSDRADTLTGSAGANQLIGGKGADELLGGAGGDRINARDGVRDTVNGGGGNDRCVTDPRETSIRSCE
ncbi:MAG: Alkaline phosphatase [uncultured Rubrobacteraceae bacterium]|uniref:Alkaline phosphatase n=1 Tax=uncultured Rubrobacteraceae bacterium TaxID=349277 RepID=A0A6J4T589_9ACTN|nr:MAG: Alkaline phosphatase [uncultured Rubrobacteraceae bacterium]